MNITQIDSGVPGWFHFRLRIYVAETGFMLDRERVSVTEGDGVCSISKRNLTTLAIYRNMTTENRSGLLFSLRRAIFTFGLAFFVVLSDVLVIHMSGVTTLQGLIEQVVIHGLGLYLAYTLRGIFGSGIRF